MTEMLIKELTFKEKDGMITKLTHEIWGLEKQVKALNTKIIDHKSKINELRGINEKNDKPSKGWCIDW